MNKLNLVTKIGPLRYGFLFLIIIFLSSCLPTPEPQPTPDHTFQTQNHEMMRPFLVTLSDIGWERGEKNEINVFEFSDGEIDFIGVALSSNPNSRRTSIFPELTQEILVYEDSTTASNKFDKWANLISPQQGYSTFVDPRIEKSIVSCTVVETVRTFATTSETFCEALFQFEHYLVILKTANIESKDAPTFEDWDRFVEIAQNRLLENAN